MVKNKQPIEITWEILLLSLPNQMMMFYLVKFGREKIDYLPMTEV